MSKKQFTHISSDGNPQMVNVSQKKMSLRIAEAQATVDVGDEILGLIRDDELITKKGPVFQTAIIAGVMGAKKDIRTDSFLSSVAARRLPGADSSCKQEYCDQ